MTGAQPGATSGRLRAALFLSIADVFLGASGLILALVVLSSPAQDPLIDRRVDLELSCVAVETGGWAVRDSAGRVHGVDDWIANATKVGLLHRVGLRVGPDQMGCFDKFNRATLRHNRTQTERAEAGVASLSLVWLPHEDSKP